MLAFLLLQACRKRAKASITMRFTCRWSGGFTTTATTRGHKGGYCHPRVRDKGACGSLGDTRGAVHHDVVTTRHDSSTSEGASWSDYGNIH